MYVNDLLARELKNHAEHHMEVQLDILNQDIIAGVEYKKLLNTMRFYEAWCDLFELTGSIIESNNNEDYNTKN